MHIFAGENDDKLPSSIVGWAWDLQPAVGTFVESAGCKWTVMYCPGTGPRFSEADNWDLYTFTPGYRITGYANTFSASTLAATNLNTTLTPPSFQVGAETYITPTTSERVLLADATISGPGQGNPAARYNYNYTSIQGGFRLPHLSPHLNLNGRFPVGGNLGMLDGHVEWRKFADMTPRTTGGSAVFWW
jgi:prepilin-type processing-associated H-X9-DG protein